MTAMPVPDAPPPPDRLEAVPLVERVAAYLAASPGELAMLAHPPARPAYEMRGAVPHRPTRVITVVGVW